MGLMRDRRYSPTNQRYAILPTIRPNTFFEDPKISSAGTF
jgi:hypothetical protein